MPSITFTSSNFSAKFSLFERLTISNLKMAKLIENAKECEIRGVIRFLNAQGVKACEISRQISVVYGDRVMS